MPDPRESREVDLHWLLHLSQEEYVHHFRDSAVGRAKRWMLQRNAAVALGNSGTILDLESLARALRHNENPIVRGHAAWAIGEIGCRHGRGVAREILSLARESEANPDVLEEIDAALEQLDEGLPAG